MTLSRSEINRRYREKDPEATKTRDGRYNDGKDAPARPLCACGCGLPTSKIVHNRPSIGVVAGTFSKYRRGHAPKALRSAERWADSKATTHAADLRMQEIERENKAKQARRDVLDRHESDAAVKIYREERAKREASRRAAEEEVRQRITACLARLDEATDKSRRGGRKKGQRNAPKENA